METARLRPRWGSWLLAGIGFAFAWLALSFVLGLGSSDARADTGSGLLGGVSSTIEHTVGTATDATTVVTTPAELAVVKTAAAVPVVGSTVAGTVTKATNTASAVVQPLAGATTGFVGKTTGPLVKTIDTSITAALSTAKEATAPLPVVGGVVAVIPGLPGVPGAASASSPGAGSAPIVAASVAASISLVSEHALDAMFLAAGQAATATDGVASVALTLFPVDGAMRLLGDAQPAGAMAPGGSSAGSSGAGPGGAAALLAFGLFFAHRAWVRRRVSDDQQAPPAPVYATDVAPD